VTSPTIASSDSIRHLVTALRRGQSGDLLVSQACAVDQFITIRTLIRHLDGEWLETTCCFPLGDMASLRQQARDLAMGTDGAVPPAPALARSEGASAEAPAGMSQPGTANEPDPRRVMLTELIAAMNRINPKRTQEVMEPFVGGRVVAVRLVPSERLNDAIASARTALETMT
jgi:hypothetical protein